MEMEVYIVNRKKSREEEPVGAWFSYPLDWEHVQEALDLDEDDQYAIDDYELPFDIEEDTSIEEVNRLCGLAEELVDVIHEGDLKVLQRIWFQNFEEMAVQKDQIKHYADCSDMTDIAYRFVCEIGQYGEVATELHNFIDFEALGRHLENERNFLETEHGVYEYVV